MSGGPPDQPRDEPRDPLEDASLRETAERVRRVMHSGEMRPAFREQLRAQVVAARAEAVAAGTAAEKPGARPGRLVALPRRRAVVAWVAAAVVAAAVALVAGGPSVNGAHPVSVAAISDVIGAVSADPAGPLRLRFSRPLDHQATQAALRLTPAAAVRAFWEGDTLTVAAVHGFAPNTPYVLLIDRAVARTASGARLASDIHVLFGTAPVAGAGPAPAAPVPLPRILVAAAADGSEAVVARDGSLLLTAARPGPATGFHRGLVRISDGTAVKLSAATDAICVSRSGSSVAFLGQRGQQTEVAFANSVGTALERAQVAVDQGSPLGWIDDAEVSYVGGGQLRGVDRGGHVRVLASAPVDAAHDQLAISPGGRYAYLRPAASAAAPGRLIDLRTGASHPLPGSTDAPAFSADGATVAWFDGSGGTPRIAVAASGGGPVLTAPLPLRPGERPSDLSLSPDGSRFAYSVARPGSRGELRLASLPDGDTLAVSTDGAGQSPNWSPSGRLFTVLSSGAAGSRIDAVSVPRRLVDRQASLEAAAAAFADAQVSDDPGAQRALAEPGTALPALPRVTRSAVLWVLASPDGTATARVRLTIDPQPARPVALQAEETLTIGPRARGSGPPVVREASAGPFRAAPPGPQLAHLDTDASPGAVLLAFDSDLDPATITAVTLTTSDGRKVPAAASYDPATRTVTLRPATATAAAVVRVGGGLRDSSGHAVSAATVVPVTLTG